MHVSNKDEGVFQCQVQRTMNANEARSERIQLTLIGTESIGSYEERSIASSSTARGPSDVDATDHAPTARTACAHHLPVVAIEARIGTDVVQR